MPPDISGWFTDPTPVQELAVAMTVTAFGFILVACIHDVRHSKVPSCYENSSVTARDEGAIKDCGNCPFSGSCFNRESA